MAAVASSLENSFGFSGPSLWRLASYLQSVSYCSELYKAKLWFPVEMKTEIHF